MAAGSAAFPPRIDVYTEADMAALCEAYRRPSVRAADELANVAVALHPRIVATLRKYGLDGSNRMGFGSDANKAAKEVEGYLRRAADHFATGATLMTFANRAFRQRVVDPVHAAKRAMDSGHANELKI